MGGSYVDNPFVLRLVDWLFPFPVGVTFSVLRVNPLTFLLVPADS